MKQIIMIFVLAISTFAQVSGQTAFSNVSLEMVQKSEVIRFTVSREVNVRHYRIEASNDNVNFDIIGTVKAVGSSIPARNYHFDLAGFNYKYYRVGVVGMDALEYSSIISISAKTQQPQPENVQPLNTDQNAVTSK